VDRARRAGVRRVVTIGTDTASRRRAASIAREYHDVYAAVGIDPNDADQLDPDAEHELEELLAGERVVAVGEIGLDYYWDRVPRGEQAQAFERQLDLAARAGLPVVIHSRDAAEDTAAILEAWAGARDGEGPHGVMHCFSGDEDMALRMVRAGFLISLAGNVTYPNARLLHRVAEAVPLDRLVLETDSPYLAPQSVRGTRNEPANVIESARAVARLRGVPVEEVAARTTANAARLFGWDRAAA
jgi:TatD DNase family protein